MSLCVFENGLQLVILITETPGPLKAEATVKDVGCRGKAI